MFKYSEEMQASWKTPRNMEDVEHKKNRSIKTIIEEARLTPETTLQSGFYPKMRSQEQNHQLRCILIQQKNP